MTALQCRILRPIPGRVRFREIPKQHCLFSYQTLEVCGTFIFKALFFPNLATCWQLQSSLRWQEYTPSQGFYRD